MPDPIEEPVTYNEPPKPAPNKSMGLFPKLGILLIISGVGIGAYWFGHRSSSSPAYVCTNPGPDEMCATDQWYESYQQFDALNSEIAKDQKSPAIAALQKKMDQALGMQDRLKQMMPCFQFAPDGKTCMVPSAWSLAKKRFVKAPSATFPVAPAVIPTPAKK